MSIAMIYFEQMAAGRFPYPAVRCDSWINVFLFGGLCPDAVASGTQLLYFSCCRSSIRTVCLVANVLLFLHALFAASYVLHFVFFLFHPHRTGCKHSGAQSECDCSCSGVCVLLFTANQSPMAMLHSLRIPGQLVLLVTILIGRQQPYSSWDKGICTYTIETCYSGEKEKKTSTGEPGWIFCHSTLFLMFLLHIHVLIPYLEILLFYCSRLNCYSASSMR